MKKILLILLSIFFLSCGVKNSNDDEHIFYLDNPSSQTNRLQARTFEILKLKTGKHIVELSDKRKYLKNTIYCWINILMKWELLYM